MIRGTTTSQPEREKREKTATDYPSSHMGDVWAVRRAAVQEFTNRQPKPKPKRPAAPPASHKWYTQMVHAPFCLTGLFPWRTGGSSGGVRHVSSSTTNLRSSSHKKKLRVPPPRKGPSPEDPRQCESVGINSDRRGPWGMAACGGGNQ